MSFCRDLVDIVKGSDVFKAADSSFKGAVSRVMGTPLGRELDILVSSALKQARVGIGASLDDIFREPQAFADAGVTAMGSVLVGKSHDFDLRFSLDRFAEYLSKDAEIPFVGVYVRTDVVSMSVETDRVSGEVVPDRMAGFEERLLDLQSPELYLNPGMARLVVPLAHRGERYGFAVFEKPKFSKRDFVSIIYCAAQFSQHIRNAKTGYYWKDAALTDYLTGLPNRRYFDHVSARTIKHCQRNGKPFSLVLLDLDRFKLINDEGGHLAGDRVLQDVAAAIRENFREGDYARYGGEEFVIALPETSYEDAHSRATEFDAVLTTISGIKKISATIGVASTEIDCCNLDGGNADAGVLLDSLLDVADTRLYETKTFRNAVFCMYGDSLTRLPNVTTFKDDLKKRLDPDKRFGGPVVIYLFNVKGMNDVINRHGPKASWEIFRDCVVSLNGDSSEFDSVARVHTRDEVIASYCPDPGCQDFRRKVEDKARRALSTLNRIPPGHFFNPLTFVLGVTVYDPRSVEVSRAREIAANPYILLGFAQQVIDEFRSSHRSGFTVKDYAGHSR